MLLCVLLRRSQMFRQLARPRIGWDLAVGVVANKILIDLSGRTTFNFMAELSLAPNPGEGERNEMAESLHL